MPKKQVSGPTTGRMFDTRTTQNKRQDLIILRQEYFETRPSCDIVHYCLYSALAPETVEKRCCTGAGLQMMLVKQ